MLTLGVQTWGTDLAALQHYWAAAESLGYDRVVYGDRSAEGGWGGLEPHEKPYSAAQFSAVTLRTVAASKPANASSIAAREFGKVLSGCG